MDMLWEREEKWIDLRMSLLEINKLLIQIHQVITIQRQIFT